MATVTFTENIDTYVKGDVRDIDKKELKRLEDYATRWGIESFYVKGAKEVSNTSDQPNITDVARENSLKRDTDTETETVTTDDVEDATEDEETTTTDETETEDVADEATETETDEATELEVDNDEPAEGTSDVTPASEQADKATDAKKK